MSNIEYHLTPDHQTVLREAANVYKQDLAAGDGNEGLWGWRSAQRLDDPFYALGNESCAVELARMGLLEEAGDVTLGFRITKWGLQVLQALENEAAAPAAPAAPASEEPDYRGMVAWMLNSLGEYAHATLAADIHHALHTGDLDQEFSHNLQYLQELLRSLHGSDQDWVRQVIEGGWYPDGENHAAPAPDAPTPAEQAAALRLMQEYRTTTVNRFAAGATGAEATRRFNELRDSGTVTMLQPGDMVMRYRVQINGKVVIVARTNSNRDRLFIWNGD